MPLALVLAMLSSEAPVHLRVDLDFALMRPTGRTPDTMSKSWFFELPKARAGQKPVEELLHRIFFDANVRLRQAEPTDTAYLMLVKFKSSPVDTDAMLKWDGKSIQPFPWHEAQKKVVWEPGVCFYVDAAGRYDTLDAVDYTELLLNRLFEAKQVDEAKFVAFFDLYIPTPPSGKVIWKDRASRFANLQTIREGPWRKKPGALPIASGPVDKVVDSLKAK